MALAFERVDEPAAWWLEAACRGMPAGRFFPARGDTLTVRYAKAVCATCPVRRPCLQSALVEERGAVAVFGVRGGATARQRLRMLGRRRLNTH